MPKTALVNYFLPKTGFLYLFLFQIRVYFNRGDNMSTLRIRSIMKEKGIGNKQLSELSGIPLGTLNKIIYGETSSPSLDNALAISKALGCTIDDLIGRKNTGYYIDDEVAQMAQDLFEREELRVLFDASRNVSKEDIEDVANILEKLKGNKEDY